MRYLVVIEKQDGRWGAHVPDLPGCVAVAESREEVLGLVREAIDLHVHELKSQGEAVPVAVCESAFVETAA